MYPDFSVTLSTELQLDLSIAWRAAWQEYSISWTKRPIALVITVPNKSRSEERSEFYVVKWFYNVFKIFENSYYFCTPTCFVLQRRWNRTVKTVFENSKFLPVKIACKIFPPYISKKFLQAIFNGKNLEFSKTVFTIRFLNFWRTKKPEYNNFQKFRNFLAIPLFTNTVFEFWISFFNQLLFQCWDCVQAIISWVE